MNKDYIIFPSSKSLMIIGLISAILAPIVGIILGVYFLWRPQMAKEGKVVLLVAAGWLTANFFLAF